MTDEILHDFVKEECARLRKDDEFSGHGDVVAAEKRLRVAIEHVEVARVDLEWARRRVAFRQFTASALEAALAAKTAP